MPDSQSAWELLATEYESIKSEQVQRIGFRDNLLFVHLAATGTVASWVLTNIGTPNVVHALLVIPWVCVVLGWTYVVNDHHVSRMGKYVREVLNTRVGSIAGLQSVDVVEGDGQESIVSEAFGWERYHRMDDLRRSRKIMQYVVDEVTFFLPGSLAIIGYIDFNSWKIHGWLVPSILVVEASSLIGLFFIILVYADFSRDH